ncbi:protein phosphatase PTC7 homolog fig [Drosophila serrata]|uniref:protein phosphatase PTC7 homolog fig n=1 Tax=Drosophila serrata TaxID=7274 RepID=UPI000A1D0D71|nr:protein phosphatase PTC7 homolog fig [Drosophila serrata]
MFPSMFFRNNSWPRLVPPHHLLHGNFSTISTPFPTTNLNQIKAPSTSFKSNADSGDPGAVDSGDPYLVKVVQGHSKEPQLPNDLTKRRFGEDSWFFSSTPSAEVLGVADGVGGWRDMGVDPGRFATELMSCCSRQAQRPEFDGKNPRELLIAGYRELTHREQPVVGSSTACLVALHRRDCTLYTANLGDSGFLVIRNGKILHRSKEQTHAFNMPFQLTVPPTGKDDHFHFDQPEMAVSTSLSLQPHDLVLLATDGLFDNMPESMLLQMLKEIRSNSKRDLQEGASLVVEKARELSLNSSFQSPFAIRARENNIFYPGGGKPDDITLILARVEVP